MKLIAVASGKGGVGKSSVTANLACAMQATGLQIGVLDADIYGPSQPFMLGETGKPEIDGQKMKPLSQFGVQFISMGNLVDQNQAMIWRGPMVSQALQQLFRDTAWGELDYLLIDLPPGTGDIQLTLAKKFEVSGAIVVTTPQDIALLDVRRAIAMFQKVDVPTLGIVENMSMHVCSACGNKEAIFGHGGGLNLAQELGVELLGQLPLDIRIREDLDQGMPTVVAAPESEIAETYRQMVRKLLEKVSKLTKVTASSFPKIVVE